eukprot:1185023-Prorocentrum_minimum.AAC.1
MSAACTVEPFSCNVECVICDPPETWNPPDGSGGPRARDSHSRWCDRRRPVTYSVPHTPGGVTAAGLLRPRAHPGRVPRGDGRGAFHIRRAAVGGAVERGGQVGCRPHQGTVTYFR